MASDVFLISTLLWKTEIEQEKAIHIEKLRKVGPPSERSTQASMESQDDWEPAYNEDEHKWKPSPSLAIFIAHEFGLAPGSEGFEIRVQMGDWRIIL